MFKIKAYLKFLWLSKNEHGVHSPFVFKLLTQCFYDKKQKNEYEILKQYRNKLLLNNNTIKITDLGAGSTVFKSNQRVIAKMAKTAGISSKRAKMLLRIINYFKPNEILELGTSLGLATIAMSLGNSKSKITSVEGCSKIAKIANQQLTQFNCNNITIYTSSFDVFLNQNNLKKKYDLIYFDGNHTKEATLNYFEHLLPTTKNNSVWIFDDIHWSKDMEQAWKIIKNHPKVQVTIDTFQWGFVFFRKEQEKEHFVIRV